jgi:DNA-binding HxlR family transcriptional regulator
LHYASIWDKVKRWTSTSLSRPDDARSGTPLPRARQSAGRARNKATPAQNDNRRSVCPVACTLDLFGDKWSLLIVRDLLSGKSHFKEFLASPEKIATNILAERLSRLASNDLIERYPSSDVAGREAYRLTEKGRSLRGLIVQLKSWGLDHIDGTDARVQANN